MLIILKKEKEIFIMSENKKYLKVPKEKEFKKSDKRSAVEDKKIDEFEIYTPQSEPNPQIPDPPVPNRAHTPI